SAAAGAPPGSSQPPPIAPRAFETAWRPAPAPRPESVPKMPPETVRELHKHIVAACGYMGHDVQVTAESATELKVHVKVRNENEARYLAKRILELPQLRQYRVTMKVDCEYPPGSSCHLGKLAFVSSLPGLLNALSKSRARE